MENFQSPQPYTMSSPGTTYEFDPGEVALASGVITVARTGAWVAAAWWAYKTVRNRLSCKAGGR